LIEERIKGHELGSMKTGRCLEPYEVVASRIGLVLCNPNKLRAFLTTSYTVYHRQLTTHGGVTNSVIRTRNDGKESLRTSYVSGRSIIKPVRPNSPQYIRASPSSESLSMLYRKCRVKIQSLFARRASARLTAEVESQARSKPQSLCAHSETSIWIVDMIYGIHSCHHLRDLSPTGMWSQVSKWRIPTRRVGLFISIFMLFAPNTIYNYVALLRHTFIIS
jgi:hypothetical protein